MMRSKGWGKCKLCDVALCEQHTLCHSTHLLEHFALHQQHAHVSWSRAVPCLRQTARSSAASIRLGPPPPCGLRSVQRGRRVTQ